MKRKVTCNNTNVAILAALCLLASCSGRQGDSTLLKHYYDAFRNTGRHSGEEKSLVMEKLKAARFLVDNMPGHTAMIGDFESYYREVDSALSAPAWDWAKKDSAIQSITQAYKSRISYVPIDKCMSEDYLVDNVEKSFNMWKNGAWARHLDFEHFCEYLIGVVDNMKASVYAAMIPRIVKMPLS